MASDLSGGSSAAGGARAVPPAARECRGARASSLTHERFSSLLQSTAVYCSLSADFSLLMAVCVAEMCVAQRVSGGDENHPKSTAGCTGCTNLFRG